MLLNIYKFLLQLYPDQYQKQYSQQILQTIEDILANEKKTGKRYWILAKEIMVTPINALEQYVIIFATERRMTPKTILSLAALMLLSPFVVALLADEIAEFTTGDHLYNTWLWSRGALIVWIVVLPFISLVISLSIYIISLIRQIKKKVSPFAKRYWLVLLTILFSAGILFLVVFHDSAHCWHGKTPINDVISCTESGILGGDSR